MGSDRMRRQSPAATAALQAAAFASFLIETIAAAPHSRRGRGAQVIRDADLHFFGLDRLGDVVHRAERQAETLSSTSPSAERKMTAESLVDGSA
jgi:hypothetical protein